MSEFFLCHHKADGPTINSAKDNTKLNGFFECHGVHCTKIKKPFSCDRYCSKITTSHINVLLMHVSEKDLFTLSKKKTDFCFLCVGNSSRRIMLLRLIVKQGWHSMRPGAMKWLYA